jgi:hypothetical protein
MINFSESERKRIGIVQSNYLPWKGYFDLIAAVDEFILYDDVQFTKNDWRNRNILKTPRGTEWISVPVGKDIHRRIRDVSLTEHRWQEKHWKTIEANYRRAPFFRDIANLLEPLYRDLTHDSLTQLNRTFIEAICRYLEIRTKISYSWDYLLGEGKNERLLNLCQQSGARHYISGPAAKGYLDEAAFKRAGVGVIWFDYTNYPTYPQLWGEFTHRVSIVDLLFNCGKSAHRHMKYAPGNN